MRYHCAHCRRPFKTSTLLASHVKSVHKSRGQRTSVRSNASSGGKSHKATQPPRATVTPLAVRSTISTPASSTETQSLHSAIRHLNAANLSLLEVRRTTLSSNTNVQPYSNAHKRMPLSTCCATTSSNCCSQSTTRTMYLVST